MMRGCRSAVRRYLASISVLLCCMAVLWFSFTNKNERLKIFSTSKAVECGEICSYEGEGSPGKFYPYIRKTVNCGKILTRMSQPGGEVVYPAPEEPPPELYSAFTQNGECPILSKVYRCDFHPNKTVTMFNRTRSAIEAFLNRDTAGENINFYKDFGLVKRVLDDYRSYLTGKRGIVVGTKQPWLEAMLLNRGASHVTTSEYEPMFFEHPKLRVVLPTQLADDILSGEEEHFDFAASYSSIEHSGLGRYGDTLDPFGDLEAVAQVWCMVRPGGLFFLGTTFNEDIQKCALTWNVHRKYGLSRLQHLTANWQVLDLRFGENDDVQPVLVLRKPEKLINVNS